VARAMVGTCRHGGHLQAWWALAGMHRMLRPAGRWSTWSPQVLPQVVNLGTPGTAGTGQPGHPRYCLRYCLRCAAGESGTLTGAAPGVYVSMCTADAFCLEVAMPPIDARAGHVVCDGLCMCGRCTHMM
jgi:hypothetical protein